MAGCRSPFARPGRIPLRPLAGFPVGTAGTGQGRPVECVVNPKNPLKTTHPVNALVADLAVAQGPPCDGHMQSAP